MRTYRRRKDSERWHWCKNCPRWPESGYVSSPKKPTYGKFCGRCRLLSDKGKCKE